MPRGNDSGSPAAVWAAKERQQKKEKQRRETKILWAAMHAMVNDIHSPQDNLTREEWAEAEWMLRELDVKMHKLAGEES